MKTIIGALLFALASLPAQAQPRLEKAIFAAGCFWCTEAAFQDVPGVTAAVSGYTGGTLKNPSYEQVSSGLTGHAEAVEVTFDPAKISYAQLLDIFWVNHDPTVTDRQFCDHGNQYRPSIFYLDAEQKRLAEASKEKFAKLKTFKEDLKTCRRGRSIPPRTTTRTSTRRTAGTTPSTSPAAAATTGWPTCGARCATSTTPGTDPTCA